MAPSIKLGYLLAIITSVAYSIWYIGSGALLKMGGSAVSPLFILFAIEAISTALVFFVGLGDVKVGRPSDAAYPILSGLFFVAANYVFYTVIINSGVPAASSFASAEIIIFTALLWLTSMGYASGKTYIFGAIFIAAGLAAESLVLRGGAYALSFTTIGLGVLIAVFAGIATYFFYLSVKRLRSRYATMFYMQGIEAVVFFVLLTLSGGHYPPLTINPLYWLLLAGVGGMLFLSFFLETVMMKILVNFKSGVIATGYILSDLELLPVLFYFLIVTPSSWLLYAPGLVLVTVGMIMLEWR